MEFLEKTPVKKVGLVFKCIFPVVMLCIFLLLLGDAVTAAKRYQQVVENPLVLDVQVTHVDVDIDTDNGNDYHAMVTYVHNGMEYVESYDVFSSEGKARELIGKQVRIFLDPENPGDQLSEIAYEAVRMLLLGCLVLLLAALCMRVRHRESYVDTYGWRREAVKKDVLRKLRFSGGDIVLLPIAFYYCVASFFPTVYLRPSFGHWIALVVFVFGLYALKNKIVRLRKAKNDAFTIRWDKFDSKDINTDSDGPDTYSITYKNGENYWTRQVSKKVYESAAEGDMIQSAYLHGEKRPVLNAHCHGKSF